MQPLGPGEQDTAGEAGLESVTSHPLVVVIRVTGRESEPGPVFCVGEQVKRRAEKSLPPKAESSHKHTHTHAYMDAHAHTNMLLNTSTVFNHEEIRLENSLSDTHTRSQHTV